MVNVHDYAHSLARALKESPENATYQAARKHIEAKPQAKEMVLDFHKKQIELQSLSIQGKEPTEQQKESLQRLYTVINGDPDVREFLAAEQRLGVLMNDIYKILGEAIDMEVGGQ
ncbi:MAG TPA: YlbF family regulator [Symbiobacteriaceae bacterium]